MTPPTIYTAELANRLARLQTLGCELKRAVQDDDRDQIERLAGQIAALADMAGWSLEKATGGWAQATLTDAALGAAREAA